MNNSRIILKLKSSSLLILTSGYLFFMVSCESNSRSGRAKMVATAMAKKESKKTPIKPSPNTIKINEIPKIVDIDEVVTPNEKDKINKVLNKKKISPVEGDLIQVEGLVFKELSELTIKLDIPSNQIKQILAIRNHVAKNWHYIFDPDSGHDTYRSAEATISLKYNGKYPGDCDDYAILMASFARQIGLKSRVIGACKSEKSCHAIAEFYVSSSESRNSLLNGQDSRTDPQGKWISLDWFRGTEHRAYKYNRRVIAQ